MSEHEICLPGGYQSFGLMLSQEDADLVWSERLLLYQIESVFGWTAVDAVSHLGIVMVQMVQITLLSCNMDASSRIRRVRRFPLRVIYVAISVKAHA